VDSIEKAEWLWDRLKDYIPDTWKCYEVAGLNERLSLLRFLKYSDGQYFKPYMDGQYRRPDGSEASYITVQLYLNGGFKGGETTFLSSKSSDEDVAVVPKAGRVLLFQHDILHEGSTLISGTKYAMRTDVMYKCFEK